MFSQFYRHRLPHFRSPGGIYHVRFSIVEFGLPLSTDWMFQIVEDGLLYLHKKTALLHAYILMPNHIHTVLQPLPKLQDPITWGSLASYYELEVIVGRLKGFTSRQINLRIGRKGSFWDDESFDRTIRGIHDYENAIEYIHDNPVRWKLVDSATEYRWSSLRTIYSGLPEYGGWLEWP